MYKWTLITSQFNKISRCTYTTLLYQRETAWTIDYDCFRRAHPIAITRAHWFSCFTPNDRHFLTWRTLHPPLMEDQGVESFHSHSCPLLNTFVGRSVKGFPINYLLQIFIMKGLCLVSHTLSTFWRRKHQQIVHARFTRGLRTRKKKTESVSDDTNKVSYKRKYIRKMASLKIANDK